MFSRIRNQMSKPPIVLCNVVLPLIFYEIRLAFLGFWGIVLIEALVIKTILKDDFNKVLKKIFFVNFLTTVIGYLLQGIARLSIIFLLIGLDTLLPKSLNAILQSTLDNPLFWGIVGNVGSNFTPMRLLQKNPIATIVEISLSFILTFIISVYFETKSLKKEYQGHEEKLRLVPAAVIKANIVSYLLLLIWVFYFVYYH